MLQVLAELLAPFARVEALNPDSDNLVNVIQATYDVRLCGTVYTGTSITFGEGQG